MARGRVGGRVPCEQCHQISPRKNSVVYIPAKFVSLMAQHPEGDSYAYGFMYEFVVQSQWLIALCKQDGS
jgi:hypothetical protein